MGAYTHLASDLVRIEAARLRAEAATGPRGNHEARAFALERAVALIRRMEIALDELAHEAQDVASVKPGGNVFVLPVRRVPVHVVGDRDGLA